jgi:invasion protein IalB
MREVTIKTRNGKLLKDFYSIGSWEQCIAGAELKANQIKETKTGDTVILRVVDNKTGNSINYDYEVEK